MTVAVIDLDGESTRNAAGILVRDVIRLGVRKMDIAWGALSDEESRTILNALSSPFFSVNYPDPQTGTQQTKIFYASDRTLPSYSWNNRLNAIKWEGLSVNLIEK